MIAISSALNKTGWNRKRAAQLLSISYRGLLYKIRRHNLVPPAEHSST
jgi:two-component system, NtrC family, response regulator AtoC